MSETLSNFLIDLASDPARLATFTADPDGVLAMSRLTGVERAAMLSGNAEELRVALAAARKGPGNGVKTTKKKKKGGGGGVKVKKAPPKPRGGGGGVKMAHGSR